MSAYLFHVERSHHGKMRLCDPFFYATELCNNCAIQANSLKPFGKLFPVYWSQAIKRFNRNNKVNPQHFFSTSDGSNHESQWLFLVSYIFRQILCTPCDTFVTLEQFMYFLLQWVAFRWGLVNSLHSRWMSGSDSERMNAIKNNSVLDHTLWPAHSPHYEMIIWDRVVLKVKYGTTFQTCWLSWLKVMYFATSLVINRVC